MFANRVCGATRSFIPLPRSINPTNQRTTDPNRKEAAMMLARMTIAFLVVCTWPFGCVGEEEVGDETAGAGLALGEPEPEIAPLPTPAAPSTRYQPVLRTETADDGSCAAQASCSADEMSCGGLCTDILLDPHNCGACGLNCSRDLVCVRGQCVEPTTDFPGFRHRGPPELSRCPPGLADCGAGCVDLRADSANCGCCAFACGARTSCENGGCL